MNEPEELDDFTEEITEEDEVSLEDSEVLIEG